MAKTISRRTLLRGAGVAMALPWLETMSKAAPATGAEPLTEPPLRMAFLYFENGVRPECWNPAGDGEQYEITTPHLKPLAPFKDDFLLLENLWHPLAQGRSPHWPKIPAWLSGSRVERTSGDNLNSNGTTVDLALPPGPQLTEKFGVGKSLPGGSEPHARLSPRWRTRPARHLLPHTRRFHGYATRCFHQQRHRHGADDRGTVQ